MWKNATLKTLLILWAVFFAINLFSGEFLVGALVDVGATAAFNEQSVEIEQEISRRRDAAKEEFLLRVKDHTPGHWLEYRKFSKYVDVPRTLLVVDSGSDHTYHQIFEKWRVDPDRTTIVNLERVGLHHIQITLQAGEKEAQYTIYIKELSLNETIAAVRRGNTVYREDGSIIQFG